MADYNVGTMEFQIISTADTASQKLANLSKQISTITKNVRSFSTAMGSVSALKDIEKLDYSKLQKTFKQLTKAVTPFLEKLKDAETSLVALSKVKNLKLPKAIASSKGSRGGYDTITQAWSMGKLIYFLNMSKRITQGIAKMAKSAVDFTETVNLFNQSMGDYEETARKFARSLAEVSGLAEGSVMEMQATFKNMLFGMKGLTEETAYSLSEILTRVVLDYSSLFNKTIEQSSTAFQAMLSGQVRPIRTGTGIDTTEITRYATYQQLGGTKTMRQLSQIEKRLLAIIAVQEQMTRMGAMGDWARTIEQPANQLKVLNEQMSELGRAIGSVFYPLLKETLPYINGFIMALKTVIMSFAEMVGYTDELATTEADPFANLVESAEEAQNVMNGLFSFDKFDVASDGKNAISSALEVDQKILDALDEYNSLSGEISQKALEIRDWLLKNEWVLNLLISSFGALISLPIIKVINAITKALSALFKGFNGLNTILSTATIYLIIDLVSNWDKLSKGAKALRITLLALVVAIKVYVAFSKIAKALDSKRLDLMKEGITATNNYIKRMKSLNAQTKAVAISTNILTGIMGALAGYGIGSMILSFIDDAEAKHTVSLIMSITGAVVALTTAILAFMGIKSGLLAPIALAGVGVFVAGLQGLIQSSKSSISGFEQGGFPQSGELYMARENGVNEFVGSFGYRNVVANNDQIVDGVASGVSSAIQPLVTIARAIYKRMDGGGASGTGVSKAQFVNAIMPEIDRYNLNRGKA